MNGRRDVVADEVFDVGTPYDSTSYSPTLVCNSIRHIFNAVIRRAEPKCVLK